MTEAEQGEVTQADREAAAAHYRAVSYVTANPWAVKVEAGKVDHDQLVQAMARHRTTALRTLEAEVARLKRLVGSYWLDDAGKQMTWKQCYDEEVRRKMEARALTKAAEAREKVLREALEWAMPYARNAATDDEGLEQAEAALSPKEPSDDQS